MLVKAKEGVKVPREDNSRRYIEGSDPVEVPKSTYYLRRVLHGDLIKVEKAAVVPKASAGGALALPAPAKDKE